MPKKDENIIPTSGNSPLDNHSFAHQNPLIAELTKDTLCNVRDALCTLKEMIRTPDSGMPEHALDGYQILMNCIIDAVNFELYDR